MTGWLLALDFGGTKLSAGLLPAGWNDAPVDSPPEWHDLRREFSMGASDYRSDIDIILRLSHEMLKGQIPAAIGVSFGGPVDADRGVVRLSHHVPGWENIPLQNLLENEFDAPVRIDNDANAAALGEQRFGAGRGFEHLLYITISTGVGGGWILNRLIWRGADSMAGEIGHTVVDPQGPLCLCGKRGCVERLASGPYMAADARQFLRKNPSGGKVLRELIGDDLDAITAAVLSRAAAAGDDLSQRLLDRSASAIGVGIGNAANLVNPQLFILGGGVTKAGEAYWQRIRSSARETALPEVNFDILPTMTGDDAPLWGAIALAQGCI